MISKEKILIRDEMNNDLAGYQIPGNALGRSAEYPAKDLCIYGPCACAVTTCLTVVRAGATEREYLVHLLVDSVTTHIVYV